MTLTENFIQNAIHLDADAEVMYGSDQMYDTYPCRFPTVEFMLSATDALVEVADRIRMEKGYLPMHPRDGRTDDVDCDGWYLSVENSYPTLLEIVTVISLFLHKNMQISTLSSVTIMLFNNGRRYSDFRCETKL